VTPWITHPLANTVVKMGASVDGNDADMMPHFDLNHYMVWRLNDLEVIVVTARHPGEVSRNAPVAQVAVFRVVGSPASTVHTPFSTIHNTFRSPNRRRSTSGRTDRLGPSLRARPRCRC
jgi:hypothetical protein